MAYEWVADNKLRDEAYLVASKEEKGPSEERVKEVYRSLGGLVLGEKVEVAEKPAEEKKPRKKK